MPGLPFQLSDSAGVHVNAGYSLLLQFSVGQLGGEAPAPTLLSSSLNVAVQASAPALDIGGKLGPLQVEVRDDASSPSTFSGTFGVTISTDQDGDITTQTILTGSADVNLILSASFGITQFVDPKRSEAGRLGQLEPHVVLDDGCDQPDRRPVGIGHVRHPQGNRRGLSVPR
ncbi:MAG: hypothetical protein ACLQIB_48815 [Isosphaeraceae bacterium]